MSREEMIDKFLTLFVAPADWEVARKALLLIVDTCELRAERKGVATLRGLTR